MSPPASDSTLPVRVAGPASLSALTILGAVQTDTPTAVAIGIGAGVLAVGAVATWRSATGWPLVGGLMAVAAGVVVACYGNPRNLGWFGLCVVAGWAAFSTPPRLAAAMGVAMAGVFGVQLLAVSREPGWVTWIAGIAFTTGACIFARRQRNLVEQLRTAQSELAERTRIEERHRIAREMHDLVGHTLTVTLLHIGSARLSLDDDLERVRVSLNEAERAARSSLDDVRAAVALLRTATSRSTLPVPTTADLATLVESFRRAGTEVDLDVRGDLSRLSANRGLAAYRIVQESLTNAARHGDGSAIKVRLDTAGERAMITVHSGATSRRPPTIGTGLAAMRERTEALGGELIAGPCQGGWRVEAVLPS